MFIINLVICILSTTTKKLGLKPEVKDPFQPSGLTLPGHSLLIRDKLLYIKLEA